jgi:hypothetical protein
LLVVVAVVLAVAAAAIALAVALILAVSVKDSLFSASDGFHRMKSSPVMP